MSGYIFLISIPVEVLLSSVLLGSLFMNSYLKSNEQTNVLVQEANALDNSGNKRSDYLKANITINGFNLIADVPTTPEGFQKGLDIKDNINENQGMLFVFKEPNKDSFWMHGMKFPIDIIWFDKYRKIVHVEHSLPPCITDLVCPSYSPEKSALYVLETKAGFSERHGVKIGTHMNFHLIK
jgi:uncharacterized membrane protein (UPF0127 family)